jgi:hypothetical protein
MARRKLSAFDCFVYGSNDFERMRETLRIAEEALARIQPQVQGALCSDDVRYALSRLTETRTFFAD